MDTEPLLVEAKGSDDLEKGSSKRTKRCLWFSIPATLIVVFGLVMLLSYYAVLYDLLESPLVMFVSNGTSKTEVKTILEWVPFFGQHYNLIKALNPSCPYKCEMTYDRSKLNSSSLLLFHIRDTNPKDLPRNNQIPRMFFSSESPKHTYLQSVFKLPPKYFNYSTTYGRYSDVRGPYSPDFPPALNYTDQQLYEFISHKKKLALVVISHCEAQRSSMLHHLKSKMNITTLGQCYARKATNEVVEAAIKEHFFYLAFENSICQDYTTEKFNRFTKFIVPVVFKRSIVPPDRPGDLFIALDDFNSTDEFIDYLKFVANNKNEYIKYLRWSQRPAVKENMLSEHQYACNLCKFAHVQPQKMVDFTEAHSMKLCDFEFVPNWIKNNTKEEKNPV